MPDIAGKVSLKTSGVDSLIMDKIFLLIRGTFHGSVTVVVQDACIIQIERQEKMRLCDLLRGSRQPHPPEADAAVMKQRILQAIDGLKYGQVVLVIKDGFITQIEKTEKRRIASGPLRVSSKS